MANVIEAFPAGSGGGSAEFPAGGTTGQVLAKHSNADNDVEWKTIDVEKDATPTEDSTNAVQSGGVYTALTDKVDKIEGKGLSTNDYDNTEKGKVATIADKADKVENAINGNLASLDENGNLADSGSKASDFASASDLDEKEDKFRFTEMPTASEDYANGKIYQYVGTSIEDLYQHGYSYECKAQGTDPETYAWEAVVTLDISNKIDKVENVTEGNFAGLDANGNLTDSGKKASDFASIEDLDDKEDVFRYDVMPIADETTLGKVVQYIGENIEGSYQKGRMYECKSYPDGSYKWTEFGGVQSENITTLNVEMNDDFTLKRVYIIYDDGFYVQPFNTVTDVNLVETIKRYYNGDITLSQIQNVWKVGNSRTMSISAMAATGVGETHAAQNVTLKLVDFNHDTLTTAINGKTKALLTLGFELAETGYYHSSHDSQKWSNTDISGGWQGCARRTWCNNVCINAIPQELRNVIKTVTRITDNGSGRGNYTAQVQTQDRVFIPTINEMLGRKITKQEGGSPFNGVSGIDCGTIYALYVNNKTHSKTLMTASTISRNSSDWTQQALQLITASGGGSYSWQDADNGIMPHFCM